MRKFLIVLFVLCFVSPAAAKPKTADIITFNPATDGGRYVTLNQSQPLYQWHFNVGMITDYTFHPLEYADPAGNRRRGIIDDLLVTNVQAALGWTDWFETGFNFPVASWETYYNPAVSSATVTKDNKFLKIGDPRIEAKFRILDINKYHVGLSVIPFFYLPLGASTYFMGNGMWSPGGKIAFDVDIKNRVFLAFNAGYRNYKNTQYDAATPNAVIDDTIELGSGVNVRINDSWGVIAEIYSEHVIKKFFKNQLQNPAEFIVAARYTPQQNAKGLGITIGGGRGLDTGVGAPDFRVFGGLNYRKPKVFELPPPAEVEVVAEEKIVITQKIHFEFNKTAIREVSYPILDDVAHLLAVNPQIRRIRVEGHTDWISSDAYNQKLSERRANAVRDYLIRKGIDANRLLAVGYGESRPIADNNSAQGRARNRRTEFTVIE